MAKQHGVEVDPQVAAQRRLHLATETQSLQVEQRGLEARHAVLEKQIAELAVKPQDDASKAILTELSAVVEARKRYVNQLRERNIAQIKMLLKTRLRSWNRLKPNLHKRKSNWQDFDVKPQSAATSVPANYGIALRTRSSKRLRMR